MRRCHPSSVSERCQLQGCHQAIYPREASQRHFCVYCHQVVPADPTSRLTQPFPDVPLQMPAMSLRIERAHLPCNDWDVKSASLRYVPLRCCCDLRAAQRTERSCTSCDRKGLPAHRCHHPSLQPLSSALQSNPPTPQSLQPAAATSCPPCAAVLSQRCSAWGSDCCQSPRSCSPSLPCSHKPVLRH